VFQTYVSFVFRRMLHLLQLDVSKLNECYISLLAFVLSRLGIRRGKAKAVPTGAGRPHVLAGRRSKRDVGGQAWDAGQRAAARPTAPGGLALVHTYTQHI
jgi:hypothetical protein